MIEGAILLLMLVSVYWLLVQAKRLTGKKVEARTIMPIFDFKSSLSAATKKTKGKF